MRFNLRPYQQAAIDDVANKMHLNPILVAPTGSGKTVMGVALVERMDVRCLWLPFSSLSRFDTNFLHS